MVNPFMSLATNVDPPYTQPAGLSFTQPGYNSISPDVGHEVCPAHVGVRLSLQCKQYENPHWSLFPSSDVTLRLDSARLGVAWVL